MATRSLPSGERFLSILDYGQHWRVSFSSKRHCLAEGSFSPTGQRLAVVANDNFSRDLMLRIYDLRAPLASQTSLSLRCNLDALLRSSRSLAQPSVVPIHRRKSILFDDRSPSPNDEDECINKGAFVAAFSPDDIYIAIGRENNMTQVLDSRFVRDNNIVCPHQVQYSGRRVVDGFGITALGWLDAAAGRNRNRNVLLTGGNDGALELTWHVT